jgi:hypothetical protein
MQEMIYVWFTHSGLYILVIFYFQKWFIDNMQKGVYYDLFLCSTWGFSASPMSIWLNTLTQGRDHKLKKHTTPK